jgi:hypothetical protein
MKTVRVPDAWASRLLFQHSPWIGIGDTDGVTTIQIDMSPAPPRLRVSPSNAHILGLPCRTRRLLQRSVDRNSFRSTRGEHDVHARCAGVAPA